MSKYGESEEYLYPSSEDNLHSPTTLDTSLRSHHFNAVEHCLVVWAIEITADDHNNVLNTSTASEFDRSLCHRNIDCESPNKTFVSELTVNEYLFMQYYEEPEKFQVRDEDHLPSDDRKPQEQFVCKICGKVSKTKKILKQHMSVHSDEKPFVCDTCGKAFKRYNQVTEHKMVHSNVKPHACETCGKPFKTKSLLKRHMIGHSDEKLHVCDTCGKAFKTNGNLREHAVVHSQENTYECDTCGKSFKSKKRVTKHMIVHSNEKPHVCEVCAKSFKSISSLKRHMFLHSN